MLNPKDSYNLNQKNSPYANCIATAKRARQLSGDAEERHIALEEKPLKLAIEEFVDGKYKVDPVRVYED